MIFQPQCEIKQNGNFLISGDVSASAHVCLDQDIMREFWKNFTFQSSLLGIHPTDEFIFTVGSADPLPLHGYAYSIHITSDGICVCAESERALIDGFMTLLDRLQATEREDRLCVKADCTKIWDRAVVPKRMVHFCILPETELWELRRFVRLCGALKYTHVVLEFWGMLRYDCLRQLSWQHAYTKEQIAPIIAEAKALGLEIVPMFNHWGHAPAGRVMHGKHVVLDQDPTLQIYFSEDGWCWDIRKPRVRELLRQIRRELIELCGEGQYFHIGCDEAYNFEMTEDNIELLCGFINEISEEMRDCNRRAVIWGDMLLYRKSTYDPKNKYTCNAPSEDVERAMLARLNRDIVIADWQYDAVNAPVETAAVFTEAGFDCLLCPWDRGSDPMNAVLETVKKQSLMGVLHTTWHTLTQGMPYVTAVAVGCLAPDNPPRATHLRTETATLVRKVMPSGGIYERAGWSKKQVDVLW